MASLLGVFADATRFIHPGHRTLLDERMTDRDWSGVLGLTGSEKRISLARAIWPALRPPERITVLAEAISGGDAPRQERAWLIRVLRGVAKRGERLFDCDAAVRALAALPAQVSVYRGTVEDEFRNGLFGVCWTLDRDRAAWFAAKHGRFRNMTSEPIVLQADVAKSAIVGHFVVREEADVILLPPTRVTMAERLAKA
jgi:hypothetical protein